MSEQAQMIARIILEQMGGSRALRVMTSAYNFTSHNESRGALSFRFKGRAKRKINYLKVTYTPMDTYTMEFGRVTKTDYKVVETLEDVYNDSLRDVFTRVTGLTLSVPLVKGINA